MFNDSFYVTLPSNASMQIYPENTLASYTNKLANRITLKEDDWEVGLVEIQYPTVFATKGIWMGIGCDRPDGVKFKIINVADGIFDTVENLTSILNEKLKGPPDFNLKFEYLKDINRVQTAFTLPDDKFNTISLSRTLAVVLGFMLPEQAESVTSFVLYKRKYKENDPIREDEQVSDTPYMRGQIINSLIHSNNTLVDVKTQFPPFLEFGIPAHMYIYSDVVSPNFIGDTLAPLLRIVKIGEHRKDICQTFSEPYYIPILKRDFETVEINIRKDTGELVPFLCGKLNVRLHFRRNHALSKKKSD